MQFLNASPLEDNLKPLVEIEILHRKPRPEHGAGFSSAVVLSP